MRSLADGDVADAIPGTDRGDEVGSMAQAIEVFLDNARKRIIWKRRRNPTAA